jgi:hypothetical protein
MEMKNLLGELLKECSIEEIEQAIIKTSEKYGNKKGEQQNVK